MFWCNKYPIGSYPFVWPIATSSLSVNPISYHSSFILKRLLNDLCVDKCVYIRCSSRTVSVDQMTVSTEPRKTSLSASAIWKWTLADVRYFYFSSGYFWPCQFDFHTSISHYGRPHRIISYRISTRSHEVICLSASVSFNYERLCEGLSMGWNQSSHEHSAVMTRRWWFCMA